MTSNWLRRTAAVAIALAVWASTEGTAFAAKPPDQTGSKYADAKKALSDAGFTVVVASRFGDRTPLEECKVVHEHLRGEAQTVKKAPTPTTVLVAVQC